MSASKLSDLLPIHVSDTDPNAYQVFGLQAGEHDSAKVQAAMQEVYAQLKAAKPTADPDLWKQAMKMADTARKLLGDPERRCALDSSLEAAGVIESSLTSVTANDDDPLAGLLPSTAAAPTPALRPPTANVASSVLGVPPTDIPAMATPPATAAVMGTPPLDASTAPVAAPATAPMVQPAAGHGTAAIGWTPPKTKRQQKKTGVYLFGFFILLMLGTIIGLLQFLSGGGRIALTKSGEKDDTGVVVSQPIPKRVSPKPRDSILGPLPSNPVTDASQNPKRGSGLGGISPLENMNPSGGLPEETAETTKPETPSMPEPQPSMPMPTPSTDPMPEKPIPDSPTPAMVQANQAKIDAVEELIRSAQWKEMKPAADALLKLNLNPEQTKRADAFYDIADLATYYRGGIERGLRSLQTGNSFDIVDNFPVIVVEVSADSLSIQYNKRTQTYALDELPPRLTEKIAAFALSPEQPDSIAGLALYRLIHPKTNDEYRRDAVKMLASVNGKLETVDSKMLQQVAKEILSK